MPHKDYIHTDGKALPSVTEILNGQPKPWLEKWKLKWGVLAERKTQAANNVGNAFHTRAECYVKGSLFNPLESRRLVGMTNVFLKWVKDTKFIAKETELHVVSDIYGYHGTFDAVGYLNNKPTPILFDWKTGSSIYPDMALQLSAYAQAYWEQTGINIKKGIIVHVSKDKPNHKLTVKEYTLGVRLFNKFLKRFDEYKQLKAEANSGC